MSDYSWNVLKLVGVMVVAAIAVWFGVARFSRFRRAGESGAEAWFYDQRTRQLYAAPRDTIPPDSRGRKGVRAVVVAFPGEEQDVRKRRIAYLETYGQPLKEALERLKLAQVSGKALKASPPERNSSLFRTNDLVRRVDAAEWYAASSPEGRKLMSEWKSWRGADGREPVVCLP